LFKSAVRHFLPVPPRPLLDPSLGDGLVRERPCCRPELTVHGSETPPAQISHRLDLARIARPNQESQLPDECVDHHRGAAGQAGGDVGQVGFPDAASTWAQAATSARPSPKAASPPRRPRVATKSSGCRAWGRGAHPEESRARDHRCPLGRDRLPGGPGRMPAARHGPGPDPVRSSRSSRRGDAPGTATCRSRGSRESRPAEPEDRSTGGSDGGSARPRQP
jgi:hypothetical protein